MEPTDAIQVISQHLWTILVVDAQGAIKECIPFDHPPPIEWADENRTRLRGCAVREIPQKELSLEELQNITKDAANYIEMFKRYES